MFDPGAFEKARKVKAANLKKLLAKKNVVGVGIGAKLKQGEPSKEIALRVYVRKKIRKAQLGKGDVLPVVLEGLPVDVVEIGEPMPFQYTARNRPAVGGDSIGHFQVTAGTLGYLLRDRTDGSAVILSNNHVLANADSTTTTRAAVGDCIVQPGTFDGGTCATDQIATLKRWIELIPEADGVNTVDCAIAAPLVAGDVVNTIHEIGCVSSWRTVSEADVAADMSDPDNVQKSGRTTGYTTGRITDVDATVVIPYASGSAIQDDCIVTTSMAAPGDSGSLLVDMNGKAVGLLFGGSPGVSVFYNKIGNVLNSLNLEFMPCRQVCLHGPIILCKIGGPNIFCRLGGPIICRSGGPNIPCRLGGGPVITCPPGGGPPVVCHIGGPYRDHCQVGGPIHCRIGGPDSIHCHLGGPDLFCRIGGPEIPGCVVGGPLLICRSGPGQCGAGPIVGCLAGPPLLDKIDPGDLVQGDIVIDLGRLNPEQRERVVQLIDKLRG